MPYNPREIPPGVDTLVARYIADELREIAAQFREVDSIQLEELHAAPDRPRDGMIILADGTDFNPGSGAGFYGRSAGAWVFLG